MAPGSAEECGERQGTAWRSVPRRVARLVVPWSPVGATRNPKAGVDEALSSEAAAHLEPTLVQSAPTLTRSWVGCAGAQG